MEIIRNRRKNPETLRLMKRSLEIARPGTMRRRCDHYAKRTIWVPHRPNKSSREKIADIDGELISRTNRLSGGYQRITANETEQNEEIELEPEERIEDTESEGKSQIIGVDFLPIVDLRSYNPYRKEAHYVQITLIVGVVTEGKKAAESTTENVEMEFMLDSKTIIAKSSTDLNRVKLAITRNDSDMTPEGYKQRFNNLSTKWGLMFNDDKIIARMNSERNF